MSVNVELSTDIWETVDGVHLCGTLLHQGRVVSCEELHELVDSIENDQIISLFTDITGSFALIVETEERTILATDTEKTVPLYYTTSGDVVVSDRYYRLEQRLSSSFCIPEGVCLEFVASRFVSKEDTLHPEIQKVAAGEIVEIRNSGELTRSAYYPSGSVDADLDIRTSAFVSDALDEAFENLHSVVGSAPVILRLSGGLDSRLVAYKLAEHDFENVYTYTHAIESDSELEPAAYIADQLGFEWIGFDHTPEDYQRFFKSDQWHEIEQLVGGYGTTEPRLRIALSLQKLSGEDTFPDSGYVLSGFSPFHAGEKFPESYRQTEKRVTGGEIADALIKHGYLLGRLTAAEQDELKAHLMDKFEIADSLTAGRGVDFFEKWHLYERLPSKSGTNIHEYNYWGYQLWYPLRDSAVLKAYERIPLADRYDRTFLTEYVTNLDEEFLENPSVVQSSPRSRLRERLENAIVETPLESSARRLRAVVRSISTTTAEALYEQRADGLRFAEIDELSDSHAFKNYLVFDELDRSRLEIERTSNTERVRKLLST